MKRSAEVYKANAAQVPAPRCLAARGDFVLTTEIAEDAKKGSAVAEECDSASVDETYADTATTRRGR
jgi:hypothetical protein